MKMTWIIVIVISILMVIGFIRLRSWESTIPQSTSGSWRDPVTESTPDLRKQAVASIVKEYITFASQGNQQELKRLIGTRRSVVGPKESPETNGDVTTPSSIESKRHSIRTDILEKSMFNMLTEVVPTQIRKANAAATTGEAQCDEGGCEVVVDLRSADGAVSILPRFRVEFVETGWKIVSVAM